MPPKPTSNQSWHLANNSQEEFLLTEFEGALWRIYFQFTSWQENCQTYICNDDKLTANEIAILHIMRAGNDRPKTVYDIGTILSRSDHHGIRYGIKKLIDLGYVKQEKPRRGARADKKTSTYSVTPSGVKNTEIYTKARKDILINLLKDYPEIIDEMDKITKSIRTITGIYDEAIRRAAVHVGTDLPELNNK